MIRILFCLSLALVSHVGFAQTSPWTLAYSFGDAGRDWGNDIAIDGMGNLYVTGAFSDIMVLDTTTLIAAGDKDMFVAKFNSGGVCLWAKSIGSLGFDEGGGIAIDQNGKVYVLGTYSDGAVTQNSSLSSAGEEDVFLGKWDADGSLEWIRTAGGALSDQGGVKGIGGGTAISIAPDGDIVVSGMFADYGGSPPLTGTAQFGNVTLTSRGNGDVFLAKYDPAGNVVWATSAGSSHIDAALDVATDTAGNIYVCGTYTVQNMMFGTLPLNGPYELFVAKYDKDGNVLWAKGAGNNLDCVMRGISTDLQGNVYIVGDYHNNPLNFGSYVLPSLGDDDIFIAKYNTSGQFQWAKSAGWGSFDHGIGIDADPNGGAVITGNFNQLGVFGIDSLFSTGSLDLFVARYDANGNVDWAVKGGGTGGEIGMSCKRMNNDDVYVTGYFTGSQSQFGQWTVPGYGDRDVFVAKLSSAIVNVAALNEEPISIFPNPGNGTFSIKASEPLERADVFDALGRTMYTCVFPVNATTKYKVDVRSYCPAGTYFIKARGKRSTYYHQLIVNN